MSFIRNRSIMLNPDEAVNAVKRSARLLDGSSVLLGDKWYNALQRSGKMVQCPFFNHRVA